MVEWKQMWEVTTWDKKFSGVKKLMQPSVLKYHYYLANELAELECPNGNIRILYTTEKKAFVNSDDVEGNIAEGEVVTIPWGGNVNIQYYKGRFVTADNRIATSNNVDYLCNKYLYYWMLSQKDEIGKFYRGAGIKHPSMLSVLKMLVPIPSISEQQRIVEQLDAFTSSIENLKEQIAQRRKQYEYYRAKLLDFAGKDGLEWKTIAEICYISDYVSNGSFASLRNNVEYKNDPDYAILVRVADYSCGFDASKFVYIDEHAYNFLAKSSLEGGEIIMSNVGSCGLLFRCPKLDRKMSLAPNAILIKSDYIDYLYYWLESNTGQEEIKKITTKSAMPKFNKTEFKKIQVPIPSISEQQHIVSVLDTFEASIANLEAQLKQREKQYEYYREKLLTF